MKKSIAKIATYGILGTSLMVTPVMAFALTGCSSNQSVVESGDRVDGKPFGAGPPPEIRGMHMDDAMEHVMERFDDCGVAPDMRFDSHMGPVGDDMGHRAKHMFDEHMPSPSDRGFVR